jgi:hypothetical protein
MTKFTTLAPVRVRTSSGDAAFFIPNSSTMLEADPQFAGKWITLGEGVEVTLCAKFEKTDTFMLAVTTPAFEDEDTGDKIPAITNGIVLRRRAFEALVDACTPKEDAPDAEEGSEA